MMKHSFDIVKLRFKTPLHLSKGKAQTYEESEEFLHSDTLKSALFAAALQLYGDALDKEAFFNSFRVSSAFPYYGNEFFFPKPLHGAPLTHENAKKQKAVKKVQWLTQKMFERLLQGKEIKLKDEYLPFNETAATETFASLSKEEREKMSLYEKEKTQRVKIPKLSEPEDAESMPFYLDKIYFDDEGGLYFMVFPSGNKEYHKQLEGALRLLGDNGIGLQKGLGNGQFDHQWEKLELDLPENATAVVSLSLYCPTWDEWSPLNLEQSAYNFVKRGGWISSADPEYISYRKRSVHMLAEGTVLPFAQNGAITLKGNGMIDLTPQTIEPPLPDEMKVWRDGTGVFLPILNNII